MRELLEFIYGYIPGFKSKDELLEDEFQKFVLTFKPEDPDSIVALKYYFKAYVSSEEVRRIIDNKQFNSLNVNPVLNINDYKAVPEGWRDVIPDYIKHYVQLNKFTID